MKHQGYAVGLESPRIEDLPEFLPGHVGWWLSYDELERPAWDLHHHYTNDGRQPAQSVINSEVKNSEVIPRNKEDEMTHWGISLYNHEVDGSLANPKTYTGYQKIAQVVNGYTSADFSDESIEKNGLLVSSVYYLVSYWYMTFFILLVFVIHSCRRTCGGYGHKYEKLSQREEVDENGL